MIRAVLLSLISYYSVYMAVYFTGIVEPAGSVVLPVILITIFGIINGVTWSVGTRNNMNIVLRLMWSLVFLAIALTIGSGGVNI